jgi:uncharacterized membrane protein
VVRSALLTAHILGVIVWLGFGAYELLLSRDIRRARGTQHEIVLITIYGKYAGYVALATLVVAIAGALMSLLLDFGFFSSFWLGTKQVIMLAVLADMVYLVPTFIATAKATSTLAEAGASALEYTRALLAKVERHVIPMRIAALVAVILAVWRPV